MLWGGKPAETLRAAENHKVIILLSEEIVGEISQVLTYSELKKIYQAEGLSHEELIEAVLKVGQFVQVTKKVSVVQEHLADNKYIECGLAANADYIVSGDRHLLKVVHYRKMQILSVAEFLQTTLSLI